MAQTLDVFEGDMGFLPRKKYNYILCINGIDAFFVNRFVMSATEDNPNPFLIGRVMPAMKHTNNQELELGDAISPNGAQSFITMIAQLTNPEIEKKKEIRLMGNYFIKMKTETLLSNFTPEAPSPRNFDYSIKKIDPIGTIHEQYDFFSCYVTSQNIDYNQNGESKINLTIHSERVLLAY